MTGEPLFDHFMRVHTVLILITRLLRNAKQVEEVRGIVVLEVLGSVTRKDLDSGNPVEPELLVVAHLVDNETPRLSNANKMITTEQSSSSGAKSFGSNTTEQSSSSGAKRFGS